MNTNDLICLLLIQVSGKVPDQAIDNSSPAFGQCMKRIHAQGLVENVAPGLEEDQDIRWRQLTPKGSAFMEMLRDTPIPVVSWIDPREELN